MALSVVNNNASFNVQQSLARTDTTSSKSLERLSTGLKIKRGADGPTALVVSERLRAQVNSLQNTTDNTNKALPSESEKQGALINGLQNALANNDKVIDFVQNAESALSQINYFLDDIRRFAGAVANTSDSPILAGVQEEIKHMLSRINEIARSTSFGTQQVFDDQPLTFQLGANAEQTVSLTLRSVTTDTLGKDATNNVDSLSTIDVRATTGALDAVKVVDKAISEIADLRSSLVAFQAKTLESAANNLGASLINATAAKAVRNVEFATDIAQFTSTQLQFQAGTAVLANANQIPQLVANLLRG